QPSPLSLHDALPISAPQPLHELERLLELGHAVLAAEPGRGQLLLAIADRHADVEAAVRDVIERGHVLGDVDRVQQRQQEHGGLEAHRAGLGREPREHRDRLRPDGRVRDPVMTDRHPGEAQPGRRAHDLHGLVDDGRGRAIGRAPERREVEADLHGMARARATPYHTSPDLLPSGPVDDLAIRGGHLIDGTGAPARDADLGLAGGRIVAIEPRSARPARRVIDARGLVVAPGFIDIHTHSDFTLPLNPRAESKIRQGVTLEVVGNCGFSAAPALPGRAALLREYLASSAPWLPFAETSYAEYVAGFPATSVNVILQVGHHTLRLMTAGMDNRPLAADEQTAMEHLLAEALQAG